MVTVIKKCFTKVPISGQIGLVLILGVVLIALLLIGTIIIGKKVALSIVGTVIVVVGSVVLLVLIFYAIIYAIISLIIYEKKNVKIAPCELVKELESFGIEEAVAQKLANEFQPKNIEMLTRKDYQFSPTHYEFLYNSLIKYLKDDCPNVKFFLTASIVKNENSHDFLSSFDVSFSFILGLTIKNLVLGEPKYKYSFYLSILNQVKEDINGGQNKGKYSKGPVPSEGNPTADLPVVGNGSDDNDNADKS